MKKMFVFFVLLFSAVFLLIAARQLSDVTYQQDHVSWDYPDGFLPVGDGYTTSACATFDFYGTAVVFYGAVGASGDVVTPSVDAVSYDTFSQYSAGTLTWGQAQFSLSGLSLDNHQLELCPSGGFYVDYAVVTTPDLTPTPTITRTSTRTPWFTPMNTLERTVSPTRTTTLTKTSTRTYTPSITPTPSRTRTSTRTPGPTRTASLTKTASRTRTNTALPSLTRTVTLTRTITRTPTASRTKTPSKTSTFTATPTP